MICPQSDDLAFVRDDCKIINSPPGFNCMIWMSSGDTQYDSLVQCISRSRLVDIGERRALVVLLMDFLNNPNFEKFSPKTTDHILLPHVETVVIRWQMGYTRHSNPTASPSSGEMPDDELEAMLAPTSGLHK